jgi:hypothetical protein
MYRQFMLHSDGGFELICWLKDDARLTRGRGLTLKGDSTLARHLSGGPPRSWYVMERYETLLAKPPEKKWKVGGLV